MTQHVFYIMYMSAARPTSIAAQYGRLKRHLQEAWCANSLLVTSFLHAWLCHCCEQSVRDELASVALSFRANSL